MWGLRVVIPTKLRSQVLQELHSAHSGMVRMKALARTHVWWPGIDAEIEQLARKCTACALESKDPSRVPLHSWDFPSRPWQRLHIDFAGPFLGKMWLIAVDAHSEWPEVIPMQLTTSERTISVLRQMFCTHGLPEQIVTDNGPQFTAAEFKQFCEKTSIRHILVAPYHPSSNEKAERFVQTFKQAMIQPVEKKGGGGGGGGGGIYVKRVPISPKGGGGVHGPPAPTLGTPMTGSAGLAYLVCALQVLCKPCLWC